MIRLRLNPTPPLLSLLPALALVVVLMEMVPGIHSGGLQSLIAFISAAFHPSMDPSVVSSAWRGLQITMATALLSWVVSTLIGVVLGLASATLIWQTFIGKSWPAILFRRLLAFPRAVHELLWGLLLLQMLGLSPWVAILAITIPYSALVARVLSDQLDSLGARPLIALRQSGARPIQALTTAIVPPMAPVLMSYCGYRLECALRGATLLGVFGLGGLGTDLQLTLQSLQFEQLWTALWMLAAVMVILEQLISWWRQRLRSSGAAPKELLVSVCLMLILGICSSIWLQSLDLDMASSIRWHQLPLPTVSELITAINQLPWLKLIFNTLLLTVLAAGIAIGLPPLGMMLWPSQLGRSIQSLLWGFLRLIPTPLAALLLLLNCEPNLAVAALALGAHNLGVMGRLLKEALDQQSDSCYQALKASGAGDRVAWLYGSLSAQSPSYLAYAAYRADVMLRETAVVGMVGGAGLGWQLIESLSSFNWAQVYLLIGVYAMLTMFGEVLSDHCRQLWTGSRKKPVMALALQS